MQLNEVKRGQIVKLTIASARPIKTMKGELHEGGQQYKVLGLTGTLVRLSRISDKAKLICLPDSVALVTNADATPVDVELRAAQAEAYAALEFASEEDDANYRVSRNKQGQTVLTCPETKRQFVVKVEAL